MKVILFILVTFSINSFAAVSFDFNNSSIVDAVVEEIPPFQTKTQERAKRIIPVVTKIAQELDVNPELVISVLWTESHFKENAKSRVGASGLMQIMPKTKNHLLNKMKDYNLYVSKYINSGLTYNELESVILGTYYLGKLLKRFKSQELAIIAYNMGPTWVSKKIANNEAFGMNHNYLKKVSNKLAIIALAD